MGVLLANQLKSVSGVPGRRDLHAFTRENRGDQLELLLVVINSDYLESGILRSQHLVPTSAPLKSCKYCSTCLYPSVGLPSECSRMVQELPNRSDWSVGGTKLTPLEINRK